MAKTAKKAGKHYTDAEIGLLYLVARSDNGKQLLANLLDRTPGAIAMAWRWLEGANFPPEAGNLIARQLEKAEKAFGTHNRGKITL